MTTRIWPRRSPVFPTSWTNRGPTHLILPVQNASLAQATAKGVEVLLGWDVAPVWQFRGSYSYLDIDTRLDAASRAAAGTYYENDSPQHQFGLRSQFHQGSWSAALSGRWVARLPGPLPDIPSYVSTDGRLAYVWPSGLEVAVSCTNLLGSHREAVSNTVGAVPTRVQREVSVSLGWRQ